MSPMSAAARDFLSPGFKTDQLHLGEDPPLMGELRDVGHYGNNILECSVG